MGAGKVVGIVLLTAGVIAIVESLVADLVGIGITPGIGGFQLVGIVVGAVAAVVGLILTLKR